MTNQIPIPYTRGSLARDQVEQLLKAINPNRVVHRPHTKPHVAQQDIIAHLIRVLGFGSFDVEVLNVELIFETERPKEGEAKMVWDAAYRALVRLHIRNRELAFVAFYDGGSTGDAAGQPSRADAHDLAYKTALSTALKRAAIFMGDQFGLSLYNKGQETALVKALLAPANDADTVQKDIEEGIEVQHEDGLHDGLAGDYDENQAQAAQEAEEAKPTAKAPARRRPAKGTQGTKVKPASEIVVTSQEGVTGEDLPAEPKPAEPTPEVIDAPEPAEEEAPPADTEPAEALAAAPTAPVQDVHAARNPDALPGETEPEYQHRKLTERKAAEAFEAAEAEEKRQRAAEAAAAEEKARAEAAEAESGERVAARIKAQREARGAPVAKEAAQAIVQAEPEPWGDVFAEPEAPEQTGPAYEDIPRAEWKARANAARNEEQLKEVWDQATEDKEMTSELKLEITAILADMRKPKA